MYKKFSDVMSRGWYRIWLVVFWIFIVINFTFFYWYIERITSEYSHRYFKEFYTSILYTIAYLALIYLVSFIIRGFKISKK